MNSNKNLVFLGMMGSGKSSIGNLVSKKLDLPFIDIDSLIIKIISLGGGGFINAKIRKEILSNHFSFWLNWDESILINRIKNSKKRPLVFNSTDREIRIMIKNRTKIYANAQFKINCNKLTKAEIVNKIVKIYEPN